MNLSVTVYQERVGSAFHWVTLGLGEHTRRESGPHAGKLQQRVIASLRALAATLPAPALARFGAVRGARLEAVRVEFTLRGERRRRKVSMACPLVVESRLAGDDARLDLAYHPARQGRWFPVDEGAPLAEQASAFFAEDWEALDDDALAQLRLVGRPALRSFSFAVSPRSLLDTLPERRAWDAPHEGRAPASPKRREVLRQVGTDLTWKAIDDALEPSLPRSPWREELRALVCAPTPQSLVVVGPAGAGRTTLLERAVGDLLEHDGYASHRNADRVRHVWRVRGARIVAGMTHLGDWQQRCLDLCAEARERRAALWFEDLPHLGRMGRSRDSDANLADFFQGPVARRELTVLGECDAEGMQRLEDDAPAFAALLARVRLAPTDRAETLRVLLHVVRRAEARNARLRVHPSALREVLEVGAAFTPERAQPGMAVELLGHAVRTTLAASPGGDAFVGAWQVRLALADRTGLKPEDLDVSAALDPEVARDRFAEQVIGQPEAVEAAVDAVMRVRAGLTDPRRPAAVYLFAGPTGTGKTELARALAAWLYDDPARLVRIDMGEYATGDAASRLVGDRWSPAGVLTRAVRAQPFCVLLLDEIEKAHPRVHDLLLQLFDDARLTDASGATVSFAHAVVVMTSNLGARVGAPAGFGARAVPSAREHVRAVQDFFAPEFFNRIDRVVPFRPLTPEVARAVAARAVARLAARRGLVEREVFVSADEGALDRVVREAFREADGARSLERWLEDHLGAMLTRHVVSQPAGALRFVRVRDGGEQGLALEVEALREAAPSPREYPLERCLSEAPEALHARLLAARDDLDAALASPALEAVSARLRALLERWREGAAGDDALYTLEALRGEVRALRERVDALATYAPQGEDWELREMELERRDAEVPDGWSLRPQRVRTYDRRAWGVGAGPSREDVFAALVEVTALRRALGAPDDTRRHGVTLELSDVGPPTDSGRSRWLMTALARGYAKARGVVVDGSVRFLDGSRKAGDGAFVAHVARSRATSAVTLTLAGPCVGDWFADEEGLHVARGGDTPLEVVRVRVMRHGDDAFAPTTNDVVRSVTLERSHGAIEVEDHRAGLTRRAVTADLEGLLVALWRVRASGM